MGRQRGRHARGIMASKDSKGMEIEVAGKGLKRLRKCTKGASSSKVKASLAKHFEVQVVEPHGLTWFNIQKEAKYAPKNWNDEGLLSLEFPAIRDRVRKLGLGFIFVEPKERNLTLVREFYAKWDTSFGESNKVKICGQVV
ncbi:hypothetical protein HAX54_047322 [Datura stramonium]|uniref:Uncharacterized protein n=1 Tax=Datura stramonium TaxID=4076 RepID=A0ABS8WKY2_DATST|nr:hypothetical protein [Datura stramonium]